MFDYLGDLGDRIGDFLSDILPFDVGGLEEGGAARPKGRTPVPNVQGLRVEDAPPQAVSEVSRLRSFAWRIDLRP